MPLELEELNLSWRIIHFPREKILFRFSEAFLLVHCFYSLFTRNKKKAFASISESYLQQIKNNIQNDIRCNGQCQS